MAQPPAFLQRYFVAMTFRLHLETEVIRFNWHDLKEKGNLLTRFKDKNDYHMPGIDNETGRVFVNFLKTQQYEVDYSAAERDPIVGDKVYKTALTCWALACFFNMPSLKEAARTHTIELADLFNPLYVVEVSANCRKASDHIPDLQDFIDFYAEKILLQTSRNVAEEILMQADPPYSPGDAYVLGQLMLKAHGEALNRAFVLFMKVPIPMLPARILPQVMQHIRQQQEANVPEPPHFHFLNEPYYVPVPVVIHAFVEPTTFKRGKMMRAMAGPVNIKQHVGTRDKEKPAKRNKGFSYLL
ncbi:hypothetical protein FBEOM_12843 [Fusarium beomiforme]|uniref:Uncharacterized protein n=1 Tax=Fusarium beomiforme TaxID=44412 RepID=A0A9P5A6S8_9HYPO|nr:hypothetical protein FBEOM_12843 [Fusarium beomiforme]